MYKPYNLKTLVYISVVSPAPVVVVVIALIDLSSSSFLLPLWIAYKHLKTTHPECNSLAPINRFKEYLATNYVPLTKN